MYSPVIALACVFQTRGDEGATICGQTVLIAASGDTTESPAGSVSPCPDLIAQIAESSHGSEGARQGMSADLRCSRRPVGRLLKRKLLVSHESPAAIGLPDIQGVCL